MFDLSEYLRSFCRCTILTKTNGCPYHSSLSPEHNITFMITNHTHNPIIQYKPYLLLVCTNSLSTLIPFNGISSPLNLPLTLGPKTFVYVFA